MLKTLRENNIPIWLDFGDHPRLGKLIFGFDEGYLDAPAKTILLSGLNKLTPKSIAQLAPQLHKGELENKLQRNLTVRIDDNSGIDYLFDIEEDGYVP